MSKVKSKNVKGASKPEPSVLTKVKDAAVTKPAQTLKAKSKELAKQVAGKEEKKTKGKPKVPEPSSDEDEDESEVEVKPKKATSNGKVTAVASARKPAPESDDTNDSESDEEDDDDSEDDDEDDEDDNVKKSAVMNGKSIKAESKSATKAAVVEQDSSDESDSSQDEDDSDDVAAGVSVPAASKVQTDDDDSDDSDDSDHDEAPAVKKAGAKIKTAPAPKLNGKAADSSDEESEDNSDEDDEDDEDDDSEDDEEVVEEAEPKRAAAKRKHEEENAPTAKKAKTDSGDKGSNLFVGNLSWNVDEAWLRQEFEEFGELSGVRLITDRDTGRSKGYGYIEYVNAADAASAFEAKKGSQLDGRDLNLDYANARPDASQKQDTRRKSYGDQVSEPSDTLFVGNLSFDVGQEAVSEAFASHGTIIGVRLPTDRETGAPKGFGYVTFASIDEATTALEAMQGAYIENRPLRLDYSQPRPQQDGSSPARGGGFRGRGGRGGFNDRGGRGRGRGGRGGFNDRGGRGGGRGSRGGSTNRGGFSDFSGRKTTF